MTTHLSPETILPGLKTQKLGRRIHCYKSLDSTQNAAKRRAEDGAEDGTLVLAETQTQGRGRFGRFWSSETGGIWASLILRPSVDPGRVPCFSPAFSLCVLESIEDLARKPCALKWPNDVLALEPEEPPTYKKVCGILTEMSARAGRVHWVVLGFGLNVSNPIPPELQATAANLSNSRATLRIELLQQILERWEKTYAKVLESGFAPFRNAYAERCVLRNRTIRLVTGTRQITGKFHDIGEDGSLLVETEGGNIETFHSGETSLKD